VENPRDPIVTGGRATLYLFSAPWCAECNNELRTLPALLHQMEERDRVHVKLFVVTGPNKEKPTEQMAKAYAESLGISLETVPDEWRWKTYRSLIKHTWNLPAAVILDEEATRALKILVGPPKYSPQDVIDSIREILKR
jgi:hypothetical protein